MIFAVAMTFIDQTIVSIAAPEIQKELGLTSTGVQWAVNAYLLSLAALFAFGGRLADTVGHRKMVTLGVIVFAGSSALCGLTPKGNLAEAWIVTFRAIQGAGQGDHVPGGTGDRGRAPERTLRPPASLKPEVGTGAWPRFPTLCGSTSPTPPALCST